MLVTLIDDIYDVASAIASRDVTDSLRLREIATWRAVELLVGDFLARETEKQNFVVAVKHPVSVLQRLVFERHRKIVYCAFPISRTRATAESRAEIDLFKSRLRESGVTTFDPVTIDDLVLLHSLKQTEDEAPEVVVRDGDRWELTDEPLLIDGRPPTHAGSKRTFDRAEIEEATRDVQRQVVTRDFRLIEDSQAVVAYRPNWGGSPSRDVTA